MSQKRFATSDYMLFQREYYNPNKFDVIFKINQEFRQYVIEQKGLNMLGPEYSVCKADGFLYLPHGYHIISGKGLPAGEPFNMITNFEKKMFIGNKKPSNFFAQGDHNKEVET